MKLKKVLEIVITSLIVIPLIVLGFVFGFPLLSELQLRTLLVVGIICGCSALYCFVVGEISRNNSQMDKLWSILPIVYTWVIAGMSGLNPRATIFAVLTTLWGVRLTINFARKGAYSIKFWSGEEDYRWVVLRQHKILGNKFVWALFDLFFISIFQNALVLAITLPALACMESTAALGVVDFIAIFLAGGFIILESVADEEQMMFYKTRSLLLKEGKTLSEITYPYSLGFNTFGLWGRNRHPNYFAEQMIWISLYLFVIGAGVGKYFIFNWSMVGPLVLVFLFLGSSTFSEGVSLGKYPDYKYYLNSVSKYLPLWKFNLEKAKAKDTQK